MRAAISIFTVVLIYSHAHIYLLTSGRVPIAPGIWYLTIFALSLLVVLMPPKNKVKNGENYDYRKHLTNRITMAVWVLIYAGVSTFSYYHSFHSEIDLRTWKTAMVNAAMIIVFLVIFKDANMIRHARQGMLFVVLLILVNNVIDIIHPNLIGFSERAGRAAGFYVNPNITGVYVVLGMILTITLIPMRYRFYYFLLIGMGVVITFSRSSMLMWLAAGVVFAWTNVFMFNRRKASMIIAGIVLLFGSVQLAGSFVRELGLDKILNADQLSRIEYNAKTDLSAQGREYVFKHALELIQEAPILGYGLGSSNDPGRTEVHPHNMFLIAWVEQGLLGLTVYVSALILMWRMRCEMSTAFVIAFTIGAMFSHNIMDDTPVYIAVAVLIGMTRKDHRKADDSLHKKSAVAKTGKSSSLAQRKEDWKINQGARRPA
jgi:O-antigen ligase